jgi:CubicO group peptidase (beta-lactamase class C family)
VDDELAWFKGYGARDLETKAPVDADTVYNIASITKPFTALAVLRLRDEGKLDAPAVTYLPELESLVYATSDSVPITLRHLLTGTSGMPNIGPLDAGKVTVSEEDVLASLRGLHIQRAPGRWLRMPLVLDGFSGDSRRRSLRDRSRGRTARRPALWSVRSARGALREQHLEVLSRHTA